MLITPEFVFIHTQKTGGTFVTEAIKELLCPNQQLKIIYKLRTKYGITLPLFKYNFKEILSKEQGQHAWCNNIPREDRNKKIISIIRNPYEFYVSAYTFGWWRKDLKGSLKNEIRDYYWEDKNLAIKKYPNLIEADFTEFMEASMEFSRWTRKTNQKYPHAKKIGMCTQRHLQFFCKNPSYVFESANDSDIFLSRFKEEHYEINFLHQETLNSDLYDFLASVGYSKSEISFIIEKEPVNVSQKEKNVMSYYNESLKNKVRKVDSILFKLFPEYD